MTKIKATEAMSQIVEVLTPFEAAERGRIIAAARTLLGDGQAGSGTDALTIASTPDELDSSSGISSKAHAWATKNAITTDELEQVFQIENGTVDVIAAEIPGKSKKDKALNSYVLLGLARFLASGDPSFTDEDARQLCETHACYDSGNHTAYLSKRGNLFNGGKTQGWKLTAPGLTTAAQLVKELGSKKQ